MKKNTVTIIIQLIVIALLAFGTVQYRRDLRRQEADSARQQMQQQLFGDELPVPDIEVGPGGIDSAGNPW